MFFRNIKNNKVTSTKYSKNSFSQSLFNAKRFYSEASNKGVITFFVSPPGNHAAVAIRYEGQVIMRSHRPDKSTQQFADHDLPKESGFSEGIATYQAKPLEIKTVEQELTIMGKHDFTVVVIPNFFPVKEIVENHISPEAYRLSKIRSPEHIKGPRDNCVTEFMWHYSYIEKEFNKVFSSNSITSIDSVIKVSDVLRIVLELAEDVNAMGGTAHVLEYKQGQDLSLFIKKLKSDL